MKYLKL